MINKNLNRWIKIMSNVGNLKYFYFRSISKLGEVRNQYSFILPLILSKIEWGDNSNTEPVADNYYLVVFILSVVIFLSFFNVIGYFFTIYLIQRYNIKEKYPYPILNKIIKYYENTGFLFVIVDCIICLLALILLGGSGFLLYYKINIF